MTRLKERSWKFWAILSLLIAIAQEILLGKFTGLAMGLGEMAVRGVVWFAGRPMWFGGLVLLMYLLVLLGVSWWQILPKTQPPPGATELESSRVALDAALHEVAELRPRLRNHEWWSNWRVNSIPQVANLNDTDRAETAKEVARLDAVLADLDKGVREVVEELVQPLLSGGSWSFDASVRDALNEEFYLPSMRLLAAVRFPPTGEDPRQLFKAFCERYREVRRWIPAVAEHFRVDMRSAAAYPRWRNADAAFFAELKRFPAIPAMAELRYEVKKYEDEGYPDELPEPLIWDAGHVEQILQNLPDAAREFLGLFLVDSPSYDDGLDEGIKLPLDVFHAGRRLVDQGVLSLRTVRPYGREPSYIFTSTDAAEAIIRRTRFTAPVVLRRSFVLTAKRIQFSEAV